VSILPIYFIGQCLALDEHPSFRETIIAQFSDPGYDWNNFIWTCSNHLVLPVIYMKFRKYDLLGYLPEVLAQHLEDIYTLNRTRNGQILLQMKEINATLNKAGIYPIYLKGTGNLIDGIYSDIGERIIGDIDLLVQDDDYFKAIDLAKDLGYVNYWGEPLKPAKRKHYPRLYKNNVPADLEIHRLPVSQKYTAHFSADLVNKSKKIVADYPGCYALSDDNKIILNFIHSQLANAGHTFGFVSLRDIYDLYCFSRRIDLEQITHVSPYRHKYNAYVDITCKLLGLPITDKPTLTSKVFIWKHDLNINSTLFNNVSRISYAISGFVFTVVPMKLKEFFYYKEARQIMFRKMRTKKWYINRLTIYKKMITG